MSSVSRCAKKMPGAKFEFSIDHILNVAGQKPNSENLAERVTVENGFEWLNCTRYRPPKLARPRKNEGVRRRKSGRNPRIPFTSSQVAMLEAKFARTPYLSSGDVRDLASYLKLSETRVKIWFQNRRAREKRDKESKVKAEGGPEQKAAEQLPRGLRRPGAAVFSPGTPFGFLRRPNDADPERLSPALRDAGSPLDLSDKRTDRGFQLFCL